MFFQSQESPKFNDQLTMLPIDVMQLPLWVQLSLNLLCAKLMRIHEYNQMSKPINCNSKLLNWTTIQLPNFASGEIASFSSRVKLAFYKFQYEHWKYTPWTRKVFPFWINLIHLFFKLWVAVFLMSHHYVSFQNMYYSCLLMQKTRVL